MLKSKYLLINLEVSFKYNLINLHMLYIFRINDLLEKTNQIINCREKINQRIEKIYRDIEEICNLIR